MKVSIWAHHSSNIFGVSNNLHFTEFFTNFGDPGPQRIVLFVAILNPAAFTIIQVETSNAVDRTECWCPAKASIHETEDEAKSEIVSVCTLRRLRELQIVDVSGDN